MAKKLINMTWEEVQAEMSIAGSPERVTKIAKEIMGTIQEKLDWSNRAEMTNIEFALGRIRSEIKGAQRRYDKTHNK